MPKAHHPRRGSLGYSPRKRAKRLVPRIKSWPKEERVRMQGFSGYKAATIHVAIVDERPHSLTHGEEIVTVATVIETPPLRVCGVRAYKKTVHGERAVTEVWTKDIIKDLARVFPLPKKAGEKLDKLKGMLEDIDDIRLIVHTQPRLSSLSKKKPEVMEYNIGGSSLEEKFQYAKEVFGKEIKLSEVFDEGEFVDVVSITQGKGFQSPVKKWGTKLLPRKTRKGRRTAGNLGPWHPAAMMWTVPQSGQMGYHQRTEYNKMILEMGEDGEKITPKSGFLRYGVIKRDYILLQGSVGGPQKRLVRIRPAIRAPMKRAEGKPDLRYISTESKRGL